MNCTEASKPKESRATVPVSGRVGAKVYRQLFDLAVDQDLSLAQLVRQAVEAYVQQQKERL